MKRLLASLILISLTIVALGAEKQYSLSSPDGSVVVKVYAGENLAYAVSVNGTCVLAKSEIALTLDNGTVYGADAKLVSAKKSSVNQTIKTIIYKKAEVVDKYNQLVLNFKDFSLTFRAYNEGAAYRFISKSKNNFYVKNETANFFFPEDWQVYVPYVSQHTETLESQFYSSFENLYKHHSLREWDKKLLAFLPLVVEASDGYKVCITEADLLNYPGMYLYNADASTTLKGVFAPYPKDIKQGGHNMLQGEVQNRQNYIAKAGAGEVFPWRVIVISKEDKDLTNNDMVYCLASPSKAGQDWSWVKPGKVAWDWWNDWNIYGVDFKSGINNDTYKYYIDFASKNGIEYVILDEGWSVTGAADLSKVVPEINLEELCAYAQARNVGIVLWAGYWAFDKDMDKICKRFSEMGVKGFKLDFMDRDDQAMVNFYVRAAQTAAKYHMFVDFHGAYKPTGLHRTYPNVVNYEGVHGLENMKWERNTDQVTYDVTIPFVRMVAGPFDYTQGAMRNASRGAFSASNSEPMSQGTRCRQLAEFIIFDAPFSMLCDSPSNYMNEPECTRFISQIPTVWDETVALDGKIAEFVATGRRKGDTWYVGAMTNWDSREINLDTSFLPAGNYSVEIYQDGANAHKAGRDFKIVETTVRSGEKISVRMAPGGGWAARFVRK